MEASAGIAGTRILYLTGGVDQAIKGSDFVFSRGGASNSPAAVATRNQGRSHYLLTSSHAFRIVLFRWAAAATKDGPWKGPKLNSGSDVNVEAMELYVYVETLV